MGLIKQWDENDLVGFPSSHYPFFSSHYFWALNSNSTVTMIRSCTGPGGISIPWSQRWGKIKFQSLSFFPSSNGQEHSLTVKNSQFLSLFMIFLSKICIYRSTSMPFNISELSVRNIRGYREFVRTFNGELFLSYHFIRHFHPLLLSNHWKQLRLRLGVGLFLTLQLMIPKCGFLKMVITFMRPGCHRQPWITQWLLEELKSWWRRKHFQIWDNFEKL